MSSDRWAKTEYQTIAPYTTPINPVETVAGTSRARLPPSPVPSRSSRAECPQIAGRKLNIRPLHPTPPRSIQLKLLQVLLALGCRHHRCRLALHEQNVL